MQQVTTLTGKIQTVAKKGGRYLIDFLPTQSTESLVFIIDDTQYYSLFPAGDPELGVPYQFEIDVTGDSDDSRVTILSTFNLNSDVIPVEEVSDYDDLAKVDLQGRDLMNFENAIKLREQFVNEVKNDTELQESLTEQLNESSKATQERIENYKATPGLESLFSEQEIEEITQSSNQAATPKDGEKPSEPVKDNQDAPRGFASRINATKKVKDE